LGSTKGSYLSNVSIVEKLSILPPNTPIPRRRIVMMKKLIAIKNLKREKVEIRRNSTRKRKTFTPKKTIVHIHE
jgi:hypothetical protein